MSAFIETSWAARTADAASLLRSVNAAPRTALQEVRETCDDHAVWAWPDGAGGVHVVIDAVDLGSAFVQGTTWLGFTINYLYPEADTYPHYVRADLARADSTPLVVPFHAGNMFLDQPAVMVSRRSPNRVSGLSTASRKALSVVSYIQAQRALQETRP